MILAVDVHYKNNEACASGVLCRRGFVFCLEPPLNQKLTNPFVIYRNGNASWIYLEILYVNSAGSVL